MEAARPFQSALRRQSDGRACRGDVQADLAADADRLQLDGARGAADQYIRTEADTDRDLFMTGKQAVEYGLVDEVIVSRSIKKV